MPNDNIKSRRVELNRWMGTTDYLDWLLAWREWSDNYHSKVLGPNLVGLGAHGFTLLGGFEQIASRGLGGWDEEALSKVKGKVQSTCLTISKEKRKPNFVGRVREKLHRWRGKPFGLSGPLGAAGQVDLAQSPGRSV